MMGLEKMTPALNMAIFGIYVKFLGCTIFVLIVFFLKAGTITPKTHGLIICSSSQRVFLAQSMKKKPSATAFVKNPVVFSADDWGVQSPSQKVIGSLRYFLSEYIYIYV